jgi:predicted nucleotidyltransferase/DNA-binding XRE family transcriptional regulator
MNPTLQSPGLLLREARTRAHLSQPDLARRAGIAQSVVSAYESGKREPSLKTLARLIAATGHRLDIELAADADARPGLPDSPLGRRLRQRRQSLLSVCARYGVKNLRVFGSVARGEDTPESDIDLLIDLPPNMGLVGLGTLERELSEKLGTKVDLIPSDSLRPRVRIEAEREAIPI